LVHAYPDRVIEGIEITKDGVRIECWYEYYNADEYDDNYEYEDEDMLLMLENIKGVYELKIE
jgi:hypothetical protein